MPTLLLVAHLAFAERVFEACLIRMLKTKNTIAQNLLKDSQQQGPLGAAKQSPVAVDSDPLHTSHLSSALDGLGSIHSPAKAPAWT